MKIKFIAMAILVPAILFGGIAATMAADVWSTTSDKTPAKYVSGSHSGEYNPADIRGSYTFTEVSEDFGIDQNVLYSAFGIPEGTDGMAVKTKDLEGMYAADTGIGNESVQVFVALYKHLPIDYEGVILPQKAAEILLAVGGLSADETTFLQQFIGQSSAPLASLPAASAQPSASGSKAGTAEETEQLVNGSATFQMVLDAGITKEQVEEIIGGSMPPTNQTIKDYCSANGLTFSDIKNQMNALAQK